MTIERKTLGDFEIKLAGDDEGVFEGLAAAFHNVDRGGDMIALGAFQKSIDDAGRRGVNPPLLWMHDHKSPIGAITHISESRAGLFVRGVFALATKAGREAHALAKSGAVRGLSIGYRVPEDGSDIARVKGKRCRRLKQIDLHEISLVSVPMNGDARIIHVKAAKGHNMTDDNILNDDSVVYIKGEIDRVADLIGERHTELEAKIADAIERTDALELKMSRPGVISSARDRSGDMQRKAFTTFLRSGREACSADEVKTLTIADDTAGGYLATPEFSREVDKNLVQFSPVRAAARVSATSAGSVIIPRRTGEPTASWVGETEARSETQAAYGQIEISVHEMACYVDVSSKLLEDAAVNVEAEVAFDLAEQFGKAEGTAFVTGNGVKKPMGFMSDPDIEHTHSGDASAITADGLLSLLYAMRPAYRSNGVWAMNGSTLAAVRKLKDGNGNYVWQMSIQAGQPETLLGRPVIEMPDMPDIAGGSYPVAFGDFSVGYRIYDRVSLSLLRDPYSVATSGLIRFHARRRVGAGVVRSEAIRKLYVST